MQRVSHTSNVTDCKMHLWVTACIMTDSVHHMSAMLHPGRLQNKAALGRTLKAAMERTAKALAGLEEFLAIKEALAADRRSRGLPSYNYNALLCRVGV